MPDMAKVDIVNGETGRSVPHDESTMGEIVLRCGLRHARLPQRREGHQGMIISGGENINRVEVGPMLYNHQAVNEAGGGGEAGRVLGQDAVRVRETQRGGVGVGVHAELPKTSTGKIQKYMLRNLAKEMGPTRKGASGSSSRL